MSTEQYTNGKALEGYTYYCSRCGGDKGYPSPSGMSVLCPNCPWQSVAVICDTPTPTVNEGNYTTLPINDWKTLQPYVKAAEKIVEQVQHTHFAFDADSHGDFQPICKVGLELVHGVKLTLLPSLVTCEECKKRIVPKTVFIDEPVELSLSSIKQQSEEYQTELFKLVSSSQYMRPYKDDDAVRSFIKIRDKVTGEMRPMTREDMESQADEPIIVEDK